MMNSFKIASIIIILLFVNDNVKSQIFHTPSGLYSSVPVHKHPDSMYAKAFFLITASGDNKMSYRLYKTICDGCDTATIRYVNNEGLSMAMLDKTIKRILPKTANHIEEKFIYPALISLHRKGK